MNTYFNKKNNHKKKIKPPNGLLGLMQILCIAEHIVWLILEGIAGYVKRIRQAKCRQANER